MSSENVRIRVKIGPNEVEIESSVDSIQRAVDLIPSVADKISSFQPAVSIAKQEQNQQSIAAVKPQELPELHVGKGESLPSMITKLFSSSWGRTPRRLLEVKDSLESYGLVYPRQSVAVALLRLAQEGKLRRFKGDDGEYLYTISTSLLTPGEGTTLQDSGVPQ